MLHPIFGGVHLEGRKEGTRRKNIALPDTQPEVLIIPLHMHAGQPCESLVKPGDVVAVGQPIGRSEQILIHSGVSGQVVAVEPRPHPWGGKRPAVVIRNDGRDTPWPESLQPADWQQLSEQDIIVRIAQAGIVGMGGGGYPTAEKIISARGKVDTLIVNAAESEPYMTGDHRLLLEYSRQVLTGMHILLKAVGVRSGVVAVEGNKLNAVEMLERTGRRCGLDCRVCAIPSRYPLGAEKQVVKAVTGREVPPQGNAIDAHCVVFNAATAYAVYQAVAEGKALTHRAVTVTGAAVARPRNLWVPIGTPIRDLIASAGGLREQPGLVIMGGPMTGIDQPDLEVPIIKTAPGVVCMLNWELAEEKEESVCIRCGRCVSVCPMHLMPLLVDKELKLGGDVKELRRLHTLDCIGCGSCSYVCPSNIPLVERMVQARRLVQDEQTAGEAAQ